MSLRTQAALARRAVQSFVRPIRGRALLTLGGTLLVAVASAAEPLAMKALVDRLTALAGRGVADGLLAGALLFGGLLAFRIVGQAWVNAMTWKVRLGVEYELRARVAAKLSTLSAHTHASIGTGGLRYAIDASSPQTAQAFTDVAFRLTPTLLYVSLAAWGMAQLNGTLTLLVLLFVPVPAIAATLAGPRQRRRDRMHHDFWTRLWSWYGEVLHGMGTVRAFARERDEERAFTRRMRWVFASVNRGVRVDAAVGVTSSLADLAARVVVLGYGGLLVVRGDLTVGALLAFLGYVGGMFAPVQLFVDLYPTVRKASVALAAVFDVLDAEDEAPDAPDAVPAPPLRGGVRFENVCFAYAGGRGAIDGVDVAIEPGQTVAIVGPSGSGKSTLLRLLQRQYVPQHGRVLLDGHDLRGLQAASVRRQLGVVPQDVVLFNDTVAANIAYGRPGATRDDVEVAARAANAHEFIMALPGGYDHVVGEGGRSLSGGQRQRVAIARAFLVDPAILMLDEATAALDTESERQVQEALRLLRRARTTFVVAHRLNTIRDADRILVVKDGRIVGDGTHDRLLAECPTYAALVGEGAAPALDLPRAA